MRSDYDIIVIGAGHAGCEAAAAAANMGVSVLLITMDLNKIAQMSCNPSIGGIAKGQIIREIDALGGFSGIVTDASTLQFRMLNRSKGPAMWSPRAQCDRMSYSMNWRWILENIPNLYLWQDAVMSFKFSPAGEIASLATALGGNFSARCYILTAGTFLNGRIFVGDKTAVGGRVSEPSSDGLSSQLSERGITMSRMKTGTPPRVDVRSVDLSKLLLQEGDEHPGRFSYLPYESSAQRGDLPQMNCYIAHTNISVHEVLRSGFDRSPLFSGLITGIGPRYCPSIEDKLRTFADRDSHQIFLEPEGRVSNEYYLQGFSSSLPFEIQLSALQLVDGFENVHLLRPAYAIEYDYFDPTLLDHTLRSRIVPNLYLAGQVNGTTGYEEAAAQGIVAAINAVLHIRGRGDEFILQRDSSYIGVLIDDLVTKGVDEPYRMFTSRAEYRILLRQDNADERLSHLSHQVGLLSDFRYRLYVQKHNLITQSEGLFLSTRLPLPQINSLLKSIGQPQIYTSKTLSELVLQPNLSVQQIFDFVPRGTTLSDEKFNLSISLADFLPSKNIPETFKTIVPSESSLLPDVLECLNTSLKYRGYIERESRLAEKMHRLESLSIPDNFDYSRLTSLSIESRMKLSKHKPRTISEASRIPGVSPADISVLLVYFGR